MAVVFLAVEPPDDVFFAAERVAVVLAAVELFAADLRAAGFLAVDFRAVDFFAAGRLAAVEPELLLPAERLELAPWSIGHLADSTL